VKWGCYDDRRRTCDHHPTIQIVAVHDCEQNGYEEQPREDVFATGENVESLAT
jgi:hypothetical protein